MAGWSAEDISDQDGRLAVVTGANSGLGLAASRGLARAGARVVLACRDTGRGEEAAGQIREDHPGAELRVERLDLADLASVREFAARMDETNEPLDILINNAGVMAAPRRLTADGFEMHFGTNHLGHFALTGLLLNRLRAAPEARVVTVSSNAHQVGRINFEDLTGERRYSRWAAYSQSKLANLLFAYELQRRGDAAGLRLRSVGVHPGYAATNLQRAGVSDGSLYGRASVALMWVGNRLLAQSDAMGALPLLYAATDPGLPGGSYVGPGGMGGMRGHPALASSSGASRDPEKARRLWEISEELTGVSYELGGAG